MRSNRNLSSIHAIRFVVLGTAASFFPQAGHAIGPYHVTDLGVLSAGHIRSVAEGINEYGQVVGVSNSNSSNSDRAFLWQPNEPNGTDGTIHYLGDLAGGAE